MRILLDTHALLWAIDDPPRLSGNAKQILTDEANQLFVSVASLLEIVLKKKAGKLALAATADYFQSNMSQLGVGEILPVQPAHVYRVNELPLHHKDPFDRLLVAQCQVEGLVLLSADPMMKKYPIQVVW